MGRELFKELVEVTDIDTVQLRNSAQGWKYLKSERKNS